MGINANYNGDVTGLFLHRKQVLDAIALVKNVEQEAQITADLAFMRAGEMRFAHCLFARIIDERRNERGQDSVLVQIIVYDITERLARERRTRYEADHDALTELKNRRAGEEILAEMLKQSVNDKQTLVLMMIDLDRFKPVNDTYGHDAGDLVLLSVSNRISHYLNNETDICIRLGGRRICCGVLFGRV